MQRKEEEEKEGEEEEGEDKTRTECRILGFGDMRKFSSRSRNFYILKILAKILYKLYSEHHNLPKNLKRKIKFISHMVSGIQMSVITKSDYSIQF